MTASKNLEHKIGCWKLTGIMLDVQSARYCMRKFMQSTTEKYFLIEALCIIVRAL
jgi:hypothetical protein